MSVKDKILGSVFGKSVPKTNTPPKGGLKKEIAGEIGESLLEGAFSRNILPRVGSFNNDQFDASDNDVQQDQSIQNTSLSTVLGSIAAFKDVMDDEYKRIIKAAEKIDGSTATMSQPLMRINYSAPMNNIIQTLDTNINIVDKKTRALEQKYASTKMLVDYNTTLLTKATLILTNIQQVVNTSRYNSIEQQIEARIRSRSANIDPNRLTRLDAYMRTFTEGLTQLDQKVSRLEQRVQDNDGILDDVKDLVKKSGVAGGAAATASALGKKFTKLPVIGTVAGAAAEGYFEYMDSGNIARTGSTALGGAVGGGVGAWGGGLAGAGAGAIIGAPFGGPIGAGIGATLGFVGAVAGSYFLGNAGAELARSGYDSFTTEEVRRIETEVHKIETILAAKNPKSVRNEYNKLITDINNLRAKFKDGKLKPEESETKLTEVESKLKLIGTTYNLDGVTPKVPLSSSPTAAGDGTVINSYGLQSYEQRESLQAQTEKNRDLINNWYVGFTATPGTYLISAKKFQLNVDEIDSEALAKFVVDTIQDQGKGGSNGGNSIGSGPSGGGSGGGGDGGGLPMPNSTGGGNGDNYNGAPSNNRDVLSSRGANDSNNESTSPSKIEGDIFNRRGLSSKELENPAIREKLLALTLAEVGNAKPETQRALLETIFNRREARGMGTLDKTMDPRYYEPFQNGAYQRALARLRSNSELRAQLEKRLEEVLDGSNDSNFATDNASGSVAANAKKTQSVRSEHPVEGGKHFETFTLKSLAEYEHIHGKKATQQNKKWLENKLKAIEEIEKEKRRQATYSDERRDGDKRPNIKPNAPPTDNKVQSGDGLISPVTGAFARNNSNIYGANRDGGLRAHSGVDWRAENGSPVLSMTDGKVVHAGVHTGYGYTVDVETPSGEVFRYATHGSNFKWKPGDIIKKGQQIGDIGLRHLHFEVIDGKYYKSVQKSQGGGGFVKTQNQRGTIDPAKYLNLQHNTPVEGGKLLDPKNIDSKHPFLGAGIKPEEKPKTEITPPKIEYPPPPPSMPSSESSLNSSPSGGNKPVQVASLRQITEAAISDIKQLEKIHHGIVTNNSKSKKDSYNEAGELDSTYGGTAYA